MSEYVDATIVNFAGIHEWAVIDDQIYDLNDYGLWVFCKDVDNVYISFFAADRELLKSRPVPANTWTWFGFNPSILDDDEIIVEICQYFVNPGSIYRSRVWWKNVTEEMKGEG